MRKITQKLKLSLRGGDTLARIGGDEFVAVIDELEQLENSHTVLSRLLEAAAQVIDVDGNRLKVTASIGVTFYPHNNCSPDHLLRCADQAMYKAKQLGKDCWHVFDIEKDVAVKHRIEEVERIRLAIKNEEFVLFYQPKIDLRTHEVIGMEALIRWQHPENGIMPPVSFLPIIENDLLSIDLGEWVINTAVKQLECWRSTPMEMPLV